jgi:glutamate 5-kinase
MSTKIVAARLATSAGVTTVITRSSNPGNILSITQHVLASRSPASLATQANAAEDDDHDTHPLSQSVTSLHLNSTTPTQIPLHTRFLPDPHPIRDRSFWILHGLAPHGTVYIDAGAHRALLGKANLLPVGVVDVEGSFAQQEAVRICVVQRRRNGPDPETGRCWDGEAVEVGRALVNYSSQEIGRIKGAQSTDIEALLGYADSEYVAQRETICFFRRESRPATPTPVVAATPVREVLEAQGGIGGYEGGAGDGM